MRFWDASAIVPLIVFESETTAMQALAAGDHGMLGRSTRRRRSRRTIG
jgi:hypothetical protein